MGDRILSAEGAITLLDGTTSCFLIAGNATSQWGALGEVARRLRVTPDGC